MTRTLIVVGLVAGLFATVGSPTIPITPTEKADADYCQCIPASLVKTGFLPGLSI